MRAAGLIVYLVTKSNISPSVVLGKMTRKEEIKVTLLNEAVEDPFFFFIRTDMTITISTPVLTQESHSNISLHGNLPSPHTEPTLTV